MAIKLLEDNNERATEKVKMASEKWANTPAAARASVITNIMLVGLFVVTGVLAFGDVSLSIKSAIDITIMTLFIYIVTTVVHHNKYDAGVLKGRLTKEYQEANAKYEAARKEVYDKKLATQMPELCFRYVKQELEAYKKMIIAETYVTWQEYLTTYQKMDDSEIKTDDDLTLEAKAAIIKANHAKPIELTANQLLNSEGNAKRRTDVLGLSPQTKTKIDKWTNSITRIFTTLLGCTIAISFVAHPTWENFGLWCSRMMPIITGYILGENAGFTTSAIAAPIYLEAKTEKLLTMLEWHARGEVQPDEEDDVSTDLRDTFKEEKYASTKRD